MTTTVPPRAERQPTTPPTRDDLDAVRRTADEAERAAGWSLADDLARAKAAGRKRPRLSDLDYSFALAEKAVAAREAYWEIYEAWHHLTLTDEQRANSAVEHVCHDPERWA